MRRAKLSSALVLFASLLGFAAVAGAHTFVNEQFKCPIDGTRSKPWWMLQGRNSACVWT